MSASTWAETHMGSRSSTVKKRSGPPLCSRFLVVPLASPESSWTPSAGTSVACSQVSFAGGGGRSAEVAVSENGPTSANEYGFTENT